MFTFAFLNAKQMQQLNQKKYTTEVNNKVSLFALANFLLKLLNARCLAYPFSINIKLLLSAEMSNSLCSHAPRTASASSSSSWWFESWALTVPDMTSLNHALKPRRNHICLRTMVFIDNESLYLSMKYESKKNIPQHRLAYSWIVEKNLSRTVK